MIKKLLLWLIVNAILPIFVPVLFLATVVWISNGKFPCYDLFFDLINSGFYIFSALTLVFSLYEDFNICQRCIGLLMQTFLVVLMFLTLAMFYQMYNNSSEYISKHQFQFYTVWGVTAIFAGIVKYKILRYKKQLAL